MWTGPLANIGDRILCVEAVYGALGISRHSHLEGEVRKLVRMALFLQVYIWYFREKLKSELIPKKMFPNHRRILKPCELPKMMVTLTMTLEKGNSQSWE